MNRTQKNAWFNIVMALLSLAFGVYIVVEIAVLQRVPKVFVRFWPLLTFWLIAGIGIIFVRKKQSPAEVDSDERDNFIKKRAALAAFVSVWIVLLVSSIVLRVILGPDGSIPVWILPILNLGLLFIVGLIHEVTILIQYGWSSKGGKS